MRTLYEAASAIEAHMLRDLLRQAGLSAQIQGEHLQGALGELPAAGLVRLVVDESDYVAARTVIDDWESAQPADVRSPPNHAAPSGWGRFVMGLLIGVALTWAYLGGPR
jgi:Putative prokaryotic signal transducing protein